MLGVYCGFTDSQLDEMKYIYYKDIIAELAILYEFETVKHLLSRDYADESTFETVKNANPFAISINKIDKPKHKRVTVGELKRLMKQ